MNYAIKYFTNTIHLKLGPSLNYPFCMGESHFRELLPRARSTTSGLPKANTASDDVTAISDSDLEIEEELRNVSLDSQVNLDVDSELGSEFDIPNGRASTLRLK